MKKRNNQNTVSAEDKSQQQQTQNQPGAAVPQQPQVLSSPPIPMYNQQMMPQMPYGMPMQRPPGMYGYPPTMVPPVIKLFYFFKINFI